MAAIIAPHGWAEGNDCSLLLRWRGPLVARAIVFRAFSAQTPPVQAQLLVIFVGVSVPPVPRGGASVSRVDSDQYAGQYEAILAAQTNFFDGDSVISPVTKSNWRSSWPARSIPSSISVAASAAACRTCARSSQSRYRRLRSLGRKSCHCAGEPELPFHIDG